MFVVSRGELHVVSDDEKVLATLKSGSYFGELSILNTGGNRRTASVRSVGYSDLFCLSKLDLWEVLKDYPKARIRLEAIALKKMQAYKKEALAKERCGMFRNKSAPGLVESSGKVSMESTMFGDDKKKGVSKERKPLTTILCQEVLTDGDRRPKCFMAETPIPQPLTLGRAISPTD